MVESPVTLVRAGFVLPIDGTTDYLRDGAVAIGGSAILELDGWAALRQRYPQAEVVGDGHGILLPGLVNVHTHLSEALLPSLTDRMNLFEWFDRILAHGLRYLDREKARVGTLL